MRIKEKIYKEKIEKPEKKEKNKAKDGRKHFRRNDGMHT
jgi:hypothetical protein